MEPRRLDDSGRLWSPGLKEGVAPGSFFHMSEVFGPVLGLMHARDLDEAIAWQNATRFGLTGGIHSLDPDEVHTWLEHVEVGNAYVNRGTTGAIVQRQPFGGWKDSAVGPGSKAGGPNYVSALGTWLPDGMPSLRRQPLPRVAAMAQTLAPLVRDDEDAAWFNASLESDAYAWMTEFGVSRDETELASERNEFRYRAVPMVIVRCENDTNWVELARVLAAAELVGTPVRLSLAGRVAEELDVLLAATGAGRALAEHMRPFRTTSDAPLSRWFADNTPVPGTRVRGLGNANHLLDEVGVEVRVGPVLTNGRRELLTMLREQSISTTLHRFGHVPPELSR